MATLHSSSPGPAVRPNFPPSSFTLFQRIFGAISVNTHGELLKLMQMKLKSVKNTTQMTLQSYVAKAYMLSYIQQKSVEFYYVLQATSKTAPTDLNRKNVFFQKSNGGFIQLGKMVSIDKMSASNSKFENLRWTPQKKKKPKPNKKKKEFGFECCLHMFVFQILARISILIIITMMLKIKIVSNYLQ